jgi:hypothetical protein
MSVKKFAASAVVAITIVAASGSTAFAEPMKTGSKSGWEGN